MKTLHLFFSFSLMLLALHCTQQSAPDTTAADKETIKAITPAWYKAYNSGDANGIVALYAEDAMVIAPGVPAVLGKAAIQEYFTKDVVASNEAGITLNGAPSKDLDVSGNIGWEWGKFTIKDKSGSTIDQGNYISVLKKKDGKWLIACDIWNSDGSMQTPEKK